MTKFLKSQVIYTISGRRKICYQLTLSLGIKQKVALPRLGRIAGLVKG